MALNRGQVNKTKATDKSVEEHIAAIANEDQRSDCRVLLKLLSQITHNKARMWGPSIVGFGTYHYKYPSGREGDSCITGFAARGKDIVVYLVASGPNQESLLNKLGRYKMGKSCLYLRRLSDVNITMLEQLVSESIAEVIRRYGSDEGRSA